MSAVRTANVETCAHDAKVPLTRLVVVEVVAAPNSITADGFIAVEYKCSFLTKVDVMANKSRIDRKQPICDAMF